MFLLTVKSSCALLVTGKEQTAGVPAVMALKGSEVATKEDEHLRHFVGSLGRLHVSQVEWQNARGAHVLPAASLNPSGQSLTH